MSNFQGMLALIAQRFPEEGIRFALIGGLALHAAGYDRSTGDIDFLIDARDIEKAKAVLSPLGYAILYESVDVLQLASPWGLIGGIDFIKAHRPYALSMLGRAKFYSFGEKISLPSVIVEDLIGLKVQSMCNDPSRVARDWADIEWLYDHHKADIDMGRLEEYFKLFSLQKEFNRLSARKSNVE